MAALKIIYVATQLHEETLQFFEDDSIEEIVDTFRAAAEAVPGALIKLYTSDGSMMKISSKLPENTPDTRYRLEIVGLPCSGPISSVIGADLHEINDSLFKVERSRRLTGPTETWLIDGWDKKLEVDRKLEVIMDKVMHDKKLWWLGLLYEPHVPRLGVSSSQAEDSRKLRLARCKKVYEDYTKYLNIYPTVEVCYMLKSISFDNWQWEDYELIILIRQMFVDLNICSKFSIDLSILQEWLFEVYISYNTPPFHNFKHCFMVTQMAYCLINLIGSHYLKDFDILVLMISAICHDIDHPGTNNTFQINMHTHLAYLYNDVAPLENHHCAIAIKTIEKCKLIAHFDSYQTIRFREMLISIILSTDMSRHADYIKKFKDISQSFNVVDRHHKELLLNIMMKISDISNEVRPLHVSNRWLDCLLEEFSQQYMEEKNNLPPGALSAFMNPDKINKARVQVEFISYVMLPLQETLAELLPVIKLKLISKLKESLNYWSSLVNNDIDEAIEQKKK